MNTAMPRFKDTDDSFRTLVQLIQPEVGLLTLYNPYEAVKILSALWAFPATPFDGSRLNKGRPAEIVYNRHPRYGKEAGLSFLLATLPDRTPFTVSHLHAADIVFYKSCNFLDMLNYDHCFISPDPFSMGEAMSCLNQQAERGVFIVQQFQNVNWGNWSQDRWKSFGCEVRPHTPPAS